MTDNVDYLILEHLKAIRGDLDTIKSVVRDVKTRLLSMESYQVASHLDSARQSSRLDELDTRISRLEVRVNLTD